MLKYFIPGVLLPILLGSCGALDTVKSTAANATKSVQETASNAGKSVKEFSLADLRPNKVNVVEVREEDLQDMPLGKERALAFEQKRKRSFWSFIPGNFEEPTLPEITEGDMDGSLLPPKPL
ncbi:hypothetical protein ACFSSA_14830 [Luteolibacter algae]|uniref:Lipoprotein n=1 Tax=Luteolibacter algae TaxID=454151 RepID=A0ABW5DDF8_9BACT